MPRITLLTSLDNPRIKHLVQLRDKQRRRREEGVLLAEGLREVGRALRAGLRLREVFVCPDLLQADPESLAALLPEFAGPAAAAPMFAVTPPVMVKISYRDDPEGLLGVFDQPRWSLDALPLPGGAWADDLWLVAISTEKPGNLGAMARSAAAAGASGLLVADAEVDAFNPNAIRTSTGAVFTLPIVSAPSATILDFLHRRRASIIAASPEATTAYTDLDLRGPMAIVIGAEDRGLDPGWREAARESGHLTTIPMSPGLVDSLNASVAAAVMLFEATRQRRNLAI